MNLIFLSVYVICRLVDYMRNGGSFKVLTSWMRFVHSFEESPPRQISQIGDCLYIEYMNGSKKYACIFPKGGNNNWVQSQVKIDDKWRDNTAEMLYFSGPLKNFHGMRTKPCHINPNYTVIAFRFPDNKVIRVKKN